MGHNNIIELNGKQYDAITGAVIRESRIKATPEKRQADARTAAHPRRVVDGVMRAHPANPAQSSPGPVPTPAAQTVNHPASAKSKTKRLDFRPVQHTHAHQPEHSRTLMRHVVSKPHTTMKPAIKKATPTEMQARSAGSIAGPFEKKLSASNVNPLRLAHAAHIPRSQHVKHFKQQPATVPAAHAIAVAVKPVHQDIARPHIPALATGPTSPGPLATPPGEHAKPDIFEQALARATSHQQPAPRVKRHNRHARLVSVLAGVAAFLVIGGFITYLNMPAMELRVASIHAGFHAVMPAYKPAGYALKGGIQSSNGQVAMQFRSGDSNYQVTQTASDWTSQTLLDYYTENHGAPAQTIQSEGRTIYLYDNNRAAWVNGGVRYEISSHASLSTQDLVSLATSM